MAEKPYPYSKFIFFLVIILVAWLVFLIVKPFINAVLAGIIISYIFYPVYKKINKLFKKNTVSAFTASILVILVITIPLILFLNAISKEAYVSYIIVKQKVLQGDLFGVDCGVKENPLCSVSDFFKEVISDPQNRFYIEDTIQRTTSYIIDNASTFLFSLPVLLLNLFIIIFLMFYLFKDGKNMFEKIKSLLPFKHTHQGIIFKQFSDVLYAVVYGQLLIALIQGTLGGIGFFVLGIPSPILWGVAMAFFALIPFVGPPIIWMPVALLQILSGLSQADNSLITKGILLALYGAFIIGTIDNFLRPKIIGERARIHPILVLLGVVGGLKLFGFIGLIIGPIILAIFMTLVRIYEEEKLLSSLK